MGLRVRVLAAVLSVAAVVLLLVLAVAVTVTSAAVFGSLVGPVAAAVAGLAPYVALAATVVGVAGCVVAVAGQRRLPAVQVVVVFAACVALAVAAVPGWSWRSRVDWPAGPGQQFTVLAVNALASNPDCGRLIASEIAWEAPDVVVVAERTACIDRGLAPALARYPYRVTARGIGLYSTAPIRDAAVHAVVPERPWLTGVVDVDGTPVTFVGVHAPAPSSPSWAGQWAGFYRALAGSVAASGGPVVMLGDFNAGSGHAPFRGLLRDGRLVDAADGLGTWPKPRQPVLLLPGLQVTLPFGFFLPLDHVLVRGVVPVHARRGAAHGSDHASLVVALRVPSRSGA